MPLCNKYLRLPDKGIGMSSEKASQSLRPDSQSLCSVTAPMLWMWMNELVSIIQFITGFCQNLNRFWGMFFYHSADIINNIFINIWNSSPKIQILEL
jgi:hypothetical protein